MAKGYTIPVDLQIDRMGWNSPIVSINQSSPVYGTKITSANDASSSEEIKSPEADIDTRHMPRNTVAIPKSKQTTMVPATNVDSLNPCSIVE